MEDLLNWNGSLWLSDSSEVASTHRNDTERPPAISATFGRRCEQVTQFAISSIGAGILCALGLLGNGVSFAILSQDRTTSPMATFLLQSLSAADSLFLVVWFLQFSLDSLFRFFGIDRAFSVVAYGYSRAYTYPLAFVAQTATVWLTVLIAASRWVVVCIPYKASSYCTVAITRRATLAVVVFSLVYNLPRFFENEIAATINRRNNVTSYQLQRSPIGRSAVYQAIYFDALYYVFSFVLPLILLSVFNFRLIVAYRAVQRRRSAMKLRRRSSRSRADSHEHNITLVMIVVILVFMLCNAPARAVQIVLRYAVQPCPSVAHFVVLMANVLEVFGSSSNFLVYVGFRKQFRRTMRLQLRKACASRNHSAGSRDPSDQTTVNRTESPPPPAVDADLPLRQSVV